MTVLKIEGVAGARRVSSNRDATQEVTVIEAKAEVYLRLSADLYMAALTPDQAAVIAEALTTAANNVRCRNATRQDLEHQLGATRLTQLDATEPEAEG
jgi:hypothetical protein